MDNNKKHRFFGAFSLIMIMVYIGIGCFVLQGCTRQYVAHETGKTISKEMTDVLQFGFVMKANYEILKDWKAGLCNVKVLSADQCKQADGFFRVYNLGLTVYGHEAEKWYLIEADPNQDKTIDAEFASALIKGLWSDRNTLIKSAATLVGEKVTLPQMKMVSDILATYEQVTADVK